MQVDELFLNCTAFLGVPTESGFLADGTAFFLDITVDETSFVYLVSCRHVVKPFKSDRKPTPNDDPIWIRVSTKGGEPKTYKTKRSDWVCHDDRFIDVCVYPCDIARWESEDGVDIGVLNADGMMLTPQKEEMWGRLRLGDQLFITGVFVGRIGDRKNIPVVRVATVAALPEEPVAFGSPRRPAYLIETKSLGGTSGSPVFLHVEPIGRAIGDHEHEIHPETGDVVLPYLLVGMMLGVHSGKYAADFIEDTDAEKVVSKDADFNAGICVVISYAQILEVIDQTPLKDARLATIEERRKQSGYRPASVPPAKAEPPTKADNPQHREDFNSLVDAAVSRSKSDLGKS